MFSRLDKAFMKDTSKFALCATKTGDSPQNSMNFSNADFCEGAPTNISSVIPVNSVVFGESFVRGSTNVQNSSTISWFFTLIAPISIILSLFALSPVVSRSKQMYSPSSFLSAFPVTIGSMSFTK